MPIELKILSSVSKDVPVPNHYSIERILYLQLHGLYNVSLYKEPISYLPPCIEYLGKFHIASMM